MFFIPVIPYENHYLLQCPICRNGTELNKTDFEEFKRIINNDGEITTNVSSVNYSGKTETQINFLKQMKEYEKEKTDIENS